MLRDHVCSRELAEKLKSLKVPQHSIFYYTSNGLMYEYEPCWLSEGSKNSDSWISAFTLSELFKLIENHTVDVEKDNLWIVWHYDFNRIIAKGASLMETLAKALIYIYEQNISEKKSNVLMFKKK